MVCIIYLIYLGNVVSFDGYYGFSVLGDSRFKRLAITEQLIEIISPVVFSRNIAGYIGSVNFTVFQPFLCIWRDFIYFFIGSSQRAKVYFVLLLKAFYT